MSKGKEKRGRCSNCPATKRILMVKIARTELALCEACRLVLSRILKERQNAANQAAARAAAPE